MHRLKFVVLGTLGIATLALVLSTPAMAVDHGPMLDGLSSHFPDPPVQFGMFVGALLVWFAVAAGAAIFLLGTIEPPTHNRWRNASTPLARVASPPPLGPIYGLSLETDGHSLERYRLRC